MSPVTTPAPAGTILNVPVKYLRESPFNPRKHYSQGALQELADSIKAQTMLQPIVARDLPAGQQDIWVRHEIVFGHRRFRAAQMAGLDEVPVVIRPFTDQQAALAQVAENLQRQDVTALEEADSFARLHNTHGMTADAIAAGVNKSRSYVYGRIKLAKVAPEVRLAVTEDGLPPDIAIEVARHADHPLQRKALKDLKTWAYGDHWPSVRDAQRRLRGMFNTNVNEAQFDPADAGLAKLAGPCATCPKRAGNDPDLLDVVDAGVCTDPGCFAVKTREHNRLELVVLASQGHPVVQGPKADAMLPNRHSRPEGYVSTHAGEYIAGRKFMSYGEMLQALAERGEPVPKETLVAVAGGTDVRRFLTDEQAEDVRLRLAGDDAQADESASTPSNAGASASMGAAGGRDTSGWTPAERVAIDRDGWVVVKRQAMRNLLRLPRTADDLRVILLREYDMGDDFGLAGEVMGIEDELRQAREADEDLVGREWVQARLARMTGDELGALLVGVALEEALGYGGWTSRALAGERVAMAERYGVDVVAAARPEQTDDAGSAGGPRAEAGAQVDAFGAVPA